ncbi:hypothetical protein N9917_03445 [Deltaproteobacteria bacterium]|nr:hypothetical protein [Deltaproteobacteria bacterium]
MRHSPSHLRVATRYLLGSDDLFALYSPFSEMVAKFADEVGNLEFQGHSGDSKTRYEPTPFKAGNLWVGVINQGNPYVKALLRLKVAPKGQAKKLEQAARVIVSARRRPKNYIKWWAKNQKHFDLLLEADGWDDKSENSSVLFKLGPFSIHNTLNLSGEELEGVTQAFKKVVRVAKKTGLSDFKKVMYGDVFVVGRIQQAHTVAWYYPAEDTVYVRPYNKAGNDETTSLLHELGHRYWKKFADRSKKEQWVRLHRRMSGKGVGKEEIGEVQLPGVGEVVTIAKFKGRGRNRRQPVVTEIKGNQIFVDTGGFFTREQFYNHAYNAAKRGRFPSAYAATNYEEHFCEALAHRAVGKLKPEAVAAFDEIWG